MTLFQLARQSFRFYWRTNLAVALGVAAATAVLTGALVVGDSMRQSLLDLTIQRLGEIDELIIAEGFFRSGIARDLQKDERYDRLTEMILFPGGTVETGGQEIRNFAANVTVLGITDEFWSFGDNNIAPVNWTSDGIAVNQALANELQITAAMVEQEKATVVVRIPKQNQLPADSALGKQTDLIESLVDLKVQHIIPNESLGRFGLYPTQADPLNVYLPIGMLQDSLSRTVLKHKQDAAQANVLLMSQSNADAGEGFPVDHFNPTMQDLGLSLKKVEQGFGDGEQREIVFEYWSLYSDRMVFTDQAADVISSVIPNAQPVFTYLANDIRKPEMEGGIPFSMVAAIDFGDSFQPISAITGDPIQPLADDEIVLHQWAANDLKASVDDKIILTYFEPETTEGDQVERSVELKLVDIAKITQPSEAFVYRRGRPLQPAVFDQRPEVTNDPDLTPEVPGVTDAESIELWELPFETADRIEAEDDDYWNFYRTTPKAYVSLARGQSLWSSRFGHVTSFRIDAQHDPDELAGQLQSNLARHPEAFGIQWVPIKQRGLAASSGSTPFDVLFLALSMFVIGSALILVALLFRLGFQQRAAEVGLMSATGIGSPTIRRVWLIEMGFVCLIGALIGIGLGIGYAALMIWGLTTWWVGAISKPFLTLHINPVSLVIGLLSGLLVCVIVIAWSLAKASRQDVRSLLSGRIESSSRSVESSRRRGKPWLAVVLVGVAIGLTVMATQLSGEAQAGSFMGAGFLVLTALLMLVYRWLKLPAEQEHVMSLASLAMTNAKRNPLRSTLTIGLVAVASFLIAAVSAFRLAPTEQGTGGFDWVATTSQPILEDLASTEGRAKSLGGDLLRAGTVVLPLRYKAGEDASCNNLYQSTQPQVLGVTDRFASHFDPSNDQDPPQFAWAATLAETEAQRANPWRLLVNDDPPHAGTQPDPIPVVIDKNTANYSLKIFSLGKEFEVRYDSGESVQFKVVGFLANTILQGSLLVAERDFEKAFPSVGGYQYFLIKDGLDTASYRDGPPEEDRSNVAMLERRLGDYGFDARSARKLLSGFMAVQNTYLSTFQTLGALGLLLGTFGLAAVQMRSVLERKKELGLMRAVGFRIGKLGSMVLLENTFLLLAGLGVGVAAALFTTLPHGLIGSASVPWLELLVMFVVIAVVGLSAGLFGARMISRMPLLESLRT